MKLAVRSETENSKPNHVKQLQTLKNNLDKSLPALTQPTRVQLTKMLQYADMILKNRGNDL